MRKVIEAFIQESDEYEIRPIANTKGAYGVYQGDELIVSADSRSEAEDELQELLDSESKLNTYIVSYDKVDKTDHVTHKDIEVQSHSEEELKQSSNYQKLHRDNSVKNLLISKLDK